MTDALWSFVDLAAGEFTGGQAYGGLDVGFAQPDGILPVLGDYPAALWRYDRERRVVVPREVPQGPTAADLQRAAAEAIGVLRLAEVGSLRAMRECLLAIHRGDPMPPEAVARLQDMEALAAETLRPAARAALGDLNA